MFQLSLLYMTIGKTVALTIVVSWLKKLYHKKVYFLGIQITVGGDYSHEMKRHLLFGRKAMTNLDNIIISRDINLPTKAHIVKATVFPVVMYECES